MPIAFGIVLLVVVGAVVWFAFHHAPPTSQLVKPAFSSPTIGSKPVSGAPSASLGDYITGQQEKGSYGL
jgi:hypothetical protein